MLFSKEIQAKAIKSSSNELAWKKEDVFLAIEELSENDYAILGGEVWAIKSRENADHPIVYIDTNKIAIGIIKGEDGIDYIFNWNIDKKSTKEWDAFVKRSKEETINSIKKLDTENIVFAEYKDFIYYNLVYVGKSGYENLFNK